MQASCISVVTLAGQGAIDAANEIGRTAVRAVTDKLVGVVEGAKGGWWRGTANLTAKDSFPPGREDVLQRSARGNMRTRRGR
jgi:hypothetical protein